MRDWTETVLCRNGHRWDQSVIADQHGQHSLADEGERDCPECGMCCVLCDGCESCEPDISSLASGAAARGRRPDDQSGGERSVDNPSRSPFERQAFAICNAYGRIAAEQLERFGRR